MRCTFERSGEPRVLHGLTASPAPIIEILASVIAIKPLARFNDIMILSRSSGERECSRCTDQRGGSRSCTCRRKDSERFLQARERLGLAHRGMRERTPRAPQKARLPQNQTLRRPKIRLPRPILVREQFRRRLRALHCQSHIIMGHAVLAHQLLNLRIRHGLAASTGLHRLELLD